MTTGYLDLSDVDTQDLYDTHLRKKLYTEGVFLLAYNARLEWEAAVNKEIICKHKSRDVAVGVKNAQDDMHAKDQITRNESFRALAAKDYRDALEYEVSRDYGMLESSVADVRLTAKDSSERNASELLNNALQVSCCTHNVDKALVKAKCDMNKSLILLRSATKTEADTICALEQAGMVAANAFQLFATHLNAEKEAYAAVVYAVANSAAHFHICEDAEARAYASEKDFISYHQSAQTELDTRASLTVGASSSW